MKLASVKCKLMEAIQSCFYCQGQELVLDLGQGNIVCTGCGTVNEMRVIQDDVSDVPFDGMQQYLLDVMRDDAPLRLS